jgi:hypothetical protein
VVGRVEVSAVPPSPAAVSVGHHLLLYCMRYCNTPHRSGRCSAGHFGLHQSRSVTECWFTTWSGDRLKSSIYYIGIGCTELKTEDRWWPTAGRSVVMADLDCMKGRRTFPVGSFVRVGVGYRSAAISFPKVSQDVPGVTEAEVIDAQSFCRR